MRGMVALSCALALGLGVAAARGDGIVPVEGPWHATTSAHLPLSFGVTGGQIVDPRWRFRWGFCGSFENAERATIPIEPDGHWKYVDPRGPWIEGVVVAPDRIEGTVTAPGRMLPSCPETKATFVASPGEATFERAEAIIQDNVRTRHYSQRPRTMVLSPDGHLKLYGLRWRDFGQPLAHASGRAYLRSGCSRCADREVRRPRVSLFANNLIEQGNYRVYFHVHWVLHGRVPPGFRHQGGRFLE